MALQKTFNGIRITVAKDYQELSDIAARIILDRIKAKPSLTLLVPTGTTYQGVYKIISNHPDKAIFSQLKFFNMDEYCLPQGKGLKMIAESDEVSYHFFMKKHLFGVISPARSFFPGIENIKKKGAYDELMAKEGGIDICLNAMGEDGHVFGFNFPGTSFASRTRMVEVNPETSQVNKKLTGLETPNHAITIGIQTGMHSREALFLVSGKRKARKLKQAIYGQVTEEVPASIMRKHGNCRWIVDLEAASELDI